MHLPTNTQGDQPAGHVRLDRVVIGVDFSAPSIAAADWAMRHFAPRAEFVLVHALDVPQSTRLFRDEFPARAEVLASARAGAAARLRELTAEQKWAAGGMEVRDGRAENVIADVASETGADLVIAGEHVRPRGITAALGSTAEALVRCSPVPVLLARGVPDHPPKQILVAVDESEHARAAFAWARLIAAQSGAAVTVYHVFRPVYLGAARSVSGLEASRTLEQDQLRQREAWLGTFVRDAGSAEGEVATRLEEGDPASALVAAQRGSAFDLVVVGSRGAGGVSRMLLGSVATAILRGASCPVLVVRGRRPAV